MPYYRSVGEIPRKRHTQFRDSAGKLYAEELMGVEGFSSDSALLYHRHLPTAIVDAAERGREFSFTRTERGGGSIRWSSRFEPSDGGTMAVLSYRVLRPVSVGLHVMLRVLFGVRDLRADLHDNMTTSLHRLAKIAQPVGPD